MATNDVFNGVACCCLDRDRSFSETIESLLDFTGSSLHRGITCLNLKLKNKYYETTVYIVDQSNLYKNLETCEKLLNDCHAIIFYANGQTVTTDQLDSKKEEFKSVSGEPRILLVDKITSDSEAHKTLIDWAIQNSYDFMNVDEEEDIKKQIVDSLSAYKWPNRLDKTSNPSSNSNATNGKDSKQLNEETLKQLMDFDSLLGKLSAYRDNPELRGNPNDKNIGEIAEILSNLLGDDVDGLLSDSDSP